MFSWLPFGTSRTPAQSIVRAGKRRGLGCRPAIEILEGRCLLSGGSQPIPPSFQPWDGILQPADGLGVNIHFTNPRPGEMAQLAAAGFRWIREDLTWSNTERQAGQYDFSAYDTLMSALNPYGIRAIFVLDYGNSLYDNGLAPHTDAGRQAFTRWAEAAVQHFQGQGIVWELWNEPNLSRFWSPAPNVQDYIALARDVGEGIRAVAPGETLVGPATSTIAFPFLQACFQGGLLDYFDAVSVHPYRSSGPETAAADYALLRSLIDQYAPAGKVIPILSSEWGYSAAQTGDEQQAKLLPREWLTNLANDIPLSIWYDWHNDGIDPTNTEHNYGTVAFPYYPGRDPVYDPKPAYESATTLTALLSGDAYQGRLGLASANDYALAFTDGANSRFVVWTASAAPQSETLPLQPGVYDAVSFVGEDLGTLVSGANGLTLTLTDAPVYLLPTANVEPPPAPVNALAFVSGSSVFLSWTTDAVNADGFTVERSDSGPDNFRVIATVTSPTFADTNLPPGNYYYRVQAFNNEGNSSYTNVANAVIGPTSPFTDHSAGFAETTDLQLNNGAAVAGTRLRLTDGGGNEGRSAWTTSKVGVLSFDTAFLLQDQSIQGSADGITFAVQNRDPGQVGGFGGALGYGGIGQSVAVMFDLFSNGSHRSTTKLLVNGNIDMTDAIDMGPSGIVLGSHHPLYVELTYDISQLTLSETVIDTVTRATFRHVYTDLDIPQIVGGTTAYVGFTGASGGETAIQDILGWYGRFLDPVQPVSHFTVSAVDSSAETTAGDLRLFTVIAEDVFGNTVPSYRGTVHLSSSDGQALLSPDATFAANDNGVLTFAAVFFTAGPQTLTATDTQTGAIFGTEIMTVDPAAASRLIVSGFPSPTPAGVVQLFTVTAVDSYGNVATGFAGTVTFSSSDTQALFQGPYTFTTTDGGTHQFAAVLLTAGAQSITVTDTADGISGAQNGIAVTPGPAVSFVIQAPSSIPAGTPFLLTIVAVDRFGNVVTDYGGTLTLSTSDAGVGVFLPPDYTFQPSDGGVARVAVLLQTEGDELIMITDGLENRYTVTVTVT